MCKIMNNKECFNKDIVQEDFGGHDAHGYASADLSGKKQHKADDPSVEDISCGDYLESCGGFCFEEGEIGPSGVSPHVDESETCQDQVVAQNSVIMGESPSLCFDFVDRVDCNTVLGDSPSVSKGAINGARTETFGKEPNLVHENATTTTNVKNDDEGVSEWALTGMPLLRRKRRS